MHPGPQYNKNVFSFMNWNLNSLAKNNFERVQLIEAHNSIFNYDLISLCETSLSESIEIPDPLLNDYTFIAANHPDNVSHGGVGLFYKNSLPLKVRSESVVVELKFGRKKMFLPSFTEVHPLNNFLLNLMISNQISKYCTRKFKRKTLMLPSLLEISFPILVARWGKHP